jgi:D-aminopeptidase
MSSTLFGWGREAHEIVAALAWTNLSNHAKEGIRPLIGDLSLASIANWADEIRPERDETYNWHFVDIPKDASGFSEERDCFLPSSEHKNAATDHHNCVVDRIQIFEHVLADWNAPREDRVEALKFLVHFVADVHQPFHSIGEAAGGNRIKVTEFGLTECGQHLCNLHGVWDSGLIQHMGMGIDEYVAHLEKLIADEHLTATGTAEDWANESHRYAEAAWLGNGAQVDEDYYRKEIRVVDERLALAGVRLAAVLNGAFAQKTSSNARPRVSDLGLKIGILPTAPLDAIPDVAGVAVGHTTIVRGDDVRTGVTAILPHSGNLFREKVPGAVFVGNAFGKLAGSTQVNELGEIETPILLTSTLSVPRVADALIDYMLALAGNEDVESINPLVGETNDGYLNDIRGRHITREDVFAAIKNAKSGPVEEGSVGAGTGTVAFGFKGGIGTSSRRLPAKLGGYTVGVLVQTNFGGVLTMAGAPVGRELGRYYLREELQQEGSVADRANGSVMIVVATDAPVDARNLKRMAARAMLGLGRTGAAGSNGSGDYVIAFSTAPQMRLRSVETATPRHVEVLPNDAMSPLFLAVIEATEEAIYNSLLRATTITGRGHTVEALPIDKTTAILRKYGAIK